MLSGLSWFNSLFFRTHTNEKGEAVFQMKIKEMCRLNRSSFEVSLVF